MIAKSVDAIPPDMHTQNSHWGDRRISNAVKRIKPIAKSQSVLRLAFELSLNSEMNLAIRLFTLEMVPYAGIRDPVQPAESLVFYGLFAPPPIVVAKR